MALEDLTPAVRVESILDGSDIEPATRLEYFLSKAANEVPKPAGSSDAGKVLTVNEDGDGFILDEVDPGLPDISGVSDAGKVVTVNAAGSAYELSTPSSGGGVSAITLSNALKTELASKLTASATSAISGSASVYVNSATITNATADDIAAIKSAATSAVNDGAVYSLEYESAVYVLSGYNAGGSPASYGFSVDLGMTEVYGHVLRPTVKIFTDETDVLVSYIIEYQY